MGERSVKVVKKAEEMEGYVEQSIDELLQVLQSQHTWKRFCTFSVSVKYLSMINFREAYFRGLS